MCAKALRTDIFVFLLFYICMTSTTGLCTLTLNSWYRIAKSTKGGRNATLKVLKPQLECQLKPIGAMEQNSTPSDMSLDD